MFFFRNKTLNKNNKTKRNDQNMYKNVLLFYYEKRILQRHVNLRRLARRCPAKLALLRLKTLECSVFIFIYQNALITVTKA